jgi:hypothetical protein
VKCTLGLGINSFELTLPGTGVNFTNEKKLQNYANTVGTYNIYITKCINSKKNTFLVYNNTENLGENPLKYSVEKTTFSVMSDRLHNRPKRISVTKLSIELVFMVV